MHFHAEHTLFFERRKPLWHTALSFVLTVSILIINASTSTTFSLVGSSVGFLLLISSYVRGHKRIDPVFAWLFGIVVTAIIGGAFLSLDIEEFLKTTTRILCGVIWILWLGSQTDWVSLRQILLLFRIPENIIASLDHALMHGVLTQREWSKKRDTARLRLGTSHLPLNTWGQIIGEGAFQGFLRLEQVEKNILLRGRSPENIKSQMINLDKIDVKRGNNIVLKQISLCFTSGEWVLLCGPSGAGKSSLLRLIGGLDNPTQGT